MSYLIDTATLLWAATAPSRVSSSATAALADPNVRLYVSSISFWEIELKIRVGKLPEALSMWLVLPPLLRRSVVEVLAFHSDAVKQLRSLPTIHKDPFDLMLICQAIANDLTIITPDQTVRRYPVKTLW